MVVEAVAATKAARALFAAYKLTINGLTKYFIKNLAQSIC